jgi:hypothetical protein
MNRRRKSNCFGQRRFLEIWRAGRLNLQGDQIEPFDRLRHRLFDHEPREASPEFQVFHSRTEPSGL